MYLFRLIRNSIYFLQMGKVILPVFVRSLISFKKFRINLNKFLGLNIRINHKIQSNYTESFCQWSVEKPNTILFSVLYGYSDTGWGVINIKLDGDLVYEMTIDSDGRYRKGIIQIKKPGNVTIEYENRGGKGIPTFYRVGKNSLIEAESSMPIVIKPDAVCAAIASYPARQNLLRDAINSLINQVDQLFIYLNNYEHPPEFILDLRAKYKNLHYIVDTNSSHRAAAKFYWLQWHECYWLICDDDIIYPDNYAETMIQHVKHYKNKSVVGVHSTIFTKGSHQWINQQRLSFESPLRKNKRVHMLGTGTLALHSSIFDKLTWKSMLDYPIENDEILAVKCNTDGIHQYAVKRNTLWLRSNKKMQYGIFEETSIDPAKKKRINQILDSGSPWKSIEVYE